MRLVRSFHERMMRLLRRVAPIRVRGHRKVPEDEQPAGSRLIRGRGRGRPRRYGDASVRLVLTLAFWTAVVLAVWLRWF